MAQSISQSLIRTSKPMSTANLFSAKSSMKPVPPPPPYVFRLMPVRNHSSHSENSPQVQAQVVDSNDTELWEAASVRRIEDAIHRIIVLRSAPDWLPFRPGSSYWVPPRRPSYGIADLVHKLANTLTEEELMSLTTLRGWPSSAFFATSPSSNLIEVETKSTGISQSEDEEG